MSRIDDLTARKTRMIADAQALVNDGKASTEEYRTLVAEIDATQQHIDLLKKLEGRMSANTPVAVTAPVAPVAADVRSDETPEQRKKRASGAIRSYMRDGYNSRLPEQRDLTVNADGVVTIPQEFDPIWIQAQRTYGPLATLVRQSKQATARPRKLIISDDTSATMSYLPETSNANTLQTDPVLLSKIPGADTLVTVVRFSYQELEDAENLDQFLADIAGLRVARAVEYALTLGKDNGSNTALPNSPAGGLLGSVPTGATTQSLAAGIGFSDLEALAFSVDSGYFAAPNAGFMASPSVFKYLASLKDSTSRPYYNIDPATGLLQILGKPLYLNAAMPAYNAASSPVVLFGDFSRAYSYLSVGGVGIQVLRERYVVDTMSAAAVIHHRIGAAKLVDGAVRALVTAAS